MNTIKVINTRTATPIVKTTDLFIEDFEDLKHFLQGMDEFASFDFDNATVIVRDDRTGEKRGVILDSDELFNTSQLTVFISPKKVSQGSVYSTAKLKEIQTYLLNIAEFLETVIENNGDICSCEDNGLLSDDDLEIIAELETRNRR
jgi:hypothetical protein